MTELVIEAVGVSKRYGDVVALDRCDLQVPSGPWCHPPRPRRAPGRARCCGCSPGSSPDSGTIDIRGRRVVGPGVFVAPEHRRTSGSSCRTTPCSLTSTCGPMSDTGWRNGPIRDDPGRRDPRSSSGSPGLGDRYPARAVGRTAAEGRPGPGDGARTGRDHPRRALLQPRRHPAFEGAQRGHRHHQRRGTTALFITHDQEEALSISDLVAVMNRGRIVQMASRRSSTGSRSTHGSDLRRRRQLRVRGAVAGQVESVLGSFGARAGGRRLGHGSTGVGPPVSDPSGRPR
jgi:iron(III) transport system ATP-binding protein